MQKWEYLVRRCQQVELKPEKQFSDLDPALRQEEGSYWLIQSINGNYTHLPKGLDELGDNGWEMIGTTPPLSLPAGGEYVLSFETNFLFLFKRLKTT